MCVSSVFATAMQPLVSLSSRWTARTRLYPNLVGVGQSSEAAVRDLAAALRRVAGLGVRVVWTAELPDIAATHLHPGDVPGAIVSLDWADPEQSWRWAGPSWTGRVPDHAPGGVTGLTIEVSDPAGAARRWAEVLGIPALGSGHTTVELPDPGQRLRFVPAPGGRGEGITEVTIAGLPAKGGGGPWVIGGVRFAGEEG